MIRSMARFSWSMSLFGARQAGEVLAALGTARSPRRAAAAFDAVAAAAESQLGELVGDAFRGGERWQERAVDAVDRLASPAIDASRTLASKTVLRGGLNLLRQSAEALGVALPGGGRRVWQELANKLEAFEHFQYAEQIVLPDRPVADALRDKVEEAFARGSYLKLWLTEGLGYAYAEAAWNGEAPDALLQGNVLDDLPAGSWLSLHTGMGLSFARQLLPTLDAKLPEADLAAALDGFADLCARNALPGYALAACEGLGLIVRHLAPEAVTAIDRAFGRGPARQREAFWHGLGRGLYFVASQAVPGTTGRAVAKVREEAPDDAAQRNALAGLAWAVTLVNFQHPEVLAGFLRAPEPGLTAAEEDAVADGVAAAFRLWLDASGRDAALTAFLDHRPDEDAERWERLVVAPCRAALADLEALKSGPGLGEMFRYRGGR